MIQRSFSQEGRRLIDLHCARYETCEERGRLFLHFTRELSPFEMAAVRDYLAGHFCAPARELFFAGAYHEKPFIPAGFDEKRTRMVFSVREKVLRKPVSTLAVLASLFPHEKEKNLFKSRAL